MLTTYLQKGDLGLVVVKTRLQPLSAKRRQLICNSTIEVSSIEIPNPGLASRFMLCGISFIMMIFFLLPSDFLHFDQDKATNINTLSGGKLEAQN
jgi:hypothetical protein